MTTTTEKLLTADELMELYSQGVRGELIRGSCTKQWLPELNTAKS